MPFDPPLLRVPIIIDYVYLNVRCAQCGVVAVLRAHGFGASLSVACWVIAPPEQLLVYDIATDRRIIDRGSGGLVANFAGLAQGGNQQRVKPAYAIFEGGGAKGITHLGALKALEQNGFELVGAAGASAGAIVAALTVVGYSADELFDQHARTDLLQSYKLKPLDLLGRRSWWWFNGLRHLTPWGIAGAAVLLLLLLASELGNYAIPWRHRGFFAIFLMFAPALSLLLPTIFRRGYLSTEQIREKLNDILRDRLREHYRDLGIEVEPPRYVRFSHIDPTVVPQCSGLKIIVSDARNGCLVQFDQSTPDVVVADAVAASAAIPFVFRPAQVRGAATDSDPVYVDGGLISNLPVWAFASEKRALEREQQGAPIPIFAFTLGSRAECGDQNDDHGQPTTSDKKIKGFIVLLLRFAAFPFLSACKPFLIFFRHAGSVLETGIFGSQTIVQEFIPDLRVIELQSPLGTLDFGCGREAAIKAFKAGLDQANSKLGEAALTTDLINGLLMDLLDRAAAKIAERRREASPTQLPVQSSIRQFFHSGLRQRNIVEKPLPRLRLYLLEPLRGGSFKVSESMAMDVDSDDRMEYDARSKLGPRAFVERRPIYAEYASKSASLWMTKYERALVRTDRRSVIAIPVFANPEARELYGQRVPVQKVLCIDSSDELQLDFEDPLFLDWLSRESVIFAKTMLKDLIDG